MYIDIITDIHIEQWDTEIENKYPCGEIINAPLEFTENIDKLLIIAGDISDNLDLSLEYLSKISKYYKKILFVDGNHEHVSKYPFLYTAKEIQTKLEKYNINNKIIFLPFAPYIEGSTAFIGYNGWWDYKNKLNSYTKEDLEYFTEWIPHLNIHDSKQFKQNVTLSSA